MPQGRYLSCVVDVSPDAGGQTRAMLMRNRIFARAAGVRPTVLTFGPTTDYAERLIRSAATLAGRRLDEFAAFCEAYERIQAQFVDDPDEDALVQGAIDGMFEGLGDPFSGYMSPDDYARAQEDLSGQFSGIGAEMGVKNVADPGDLAAGLLRHADQ